MLLTPSQRRPRRPRVWLHRRSLEWRLAAGADPATSPDLARRAEQLCDPRLRRKLAADLEEAVEEADAAPGLLTAQVPLHRRAVHESRALLIGLARDLRSGRAVSAQAVALVRGLLTDGGSPLYGAAPPNELQDAIRRASEAI